MDPDVEEQVNFTNTRITGPKKSKPVKQDVCPWCADPADRNGKTDCRAHGRQCYACGRMIQLSIACKHQIPNWRELTEVAHFHQNKKNKLDVSMWKNPDRKDQLFISEKAKTNLRTSILAA